MRTFLYVSAFISLLLGCAKSSDVKLDIDNERLEVRTIWKSSAYLAFTDIVRFHNKWYCVFREASSHTSFDGKLRVMVSNDAQNWSMDTVLSISGADLRDPKFVTGLNDELLINAGARNPRLNNVLWHYNDDENSWGKPSFADVSDDWLWSIRRNGETLYSLAYKYNSARTSSELSLYSSNKQIFPVFKLSKRNLIDKGCPTEASFLFQYQDSILVFARRDCDDRSTWIGSGKYPFDSIRWASLHMIVESPNLINIHNQIFVAGRYYSPTSRTTLFKLSQAGNSLTKLTDLPSERDSGYPGMVFYQNKIFISYYSTDKHGNGGIYLGVYRLN